MIFRIDVSHDEHATILAALRYYQEQGMGEPDNRSNAIHEIATASYTDHKGEEHEVLSSLDDEWIDKLCERVNTDIQEHRPIYRHDCKKCQFTRNLIVEGGPRVHDCYYCPGTQSMLVRHSNEPSDYWSMPLQGILQVDDAGGSKKDLMFQEVMSIVEYFNLRDELKEKKSS
jgi:hypothetical protein